MWLCAVAVFLQGHLNLWCFSSVSSAPQTGAHLINRWCSNHSSTWARPGLGQCSSCSLAYDSPATNSTWVWWEPAAVFPKAACSACEHSEHVACSRARWAALQHQKSTAVCQNLLSHPVCDMLSIRDKLEMFCYLLSACLQGSWLPVILILCNHCSLCYGPTPQNLPSTLPWLLVSIQLFA